MTNFFTRNDLKYYARRYHDMEFILAVIFIMGFRDRPREETSRTATLILFFALCRIASSSIATLKILSYKLYIDNEKDKTPYYTFDCTANITRGEYYTYKTKNHFNATFEFFEMIADILALIPALLYLWHFWDTYWDGYNTDLPDDEPCRGIIYCSVAMVFKWYVLIGIVYYAGLFVIYAAQAIVRHLIYAVKPREDNQGACQPKACRQ